MAIVAQQPVVANPQTVEQAIGTALWNRCNAHFNQFLGQVGLGFGYDACNAAVAIQTHPRYDVCTALPLLHDNFSVLYGTSRLFQGLDPDFNALHGGHVAPNRPFANAALGEHAEQSAIRTAENQHLNWFVHAGNTHIYIDYTPCPVCGPWLNARPENWYVHYRAALNHHAAVPTEKRKMRRETFGRMKEPRQKRRRT